MDKQHAVINYEAGTDEHKVKDLGSLNGVSTQIEICKSESSKVTQEKGQFEESTWSHDAGDGEVGWDRVEKR